MSDFFANESKPEKIVLDGGGGEGVLPGVG